MKTYRLWFATLLLSLTCAQVCAQDYNSITPDGTITPAHSRSDSLGSGKKDIPRGMHVWTVDERFGDITPAEPDTLSYMFMNTIFTTGMHGEFNTTGNLGAPRLNRVFTDRKEISGDFPFNQYQDYFIVNPGDFHFTNTYSPVTNLSLNTCGNRTNGEDHFKALFAVNAGKRLGVGMKFDYLYGRGYYSDNSAALFNYTTWGSYLGDRYQAHLLFSTNHQKQAENGGITNDNFITHPETFNDNYAESEIPTMLSQHWNRNDNQHVFLTHRYSVGFNRKVPMTEEEIKAKKFAMESQKENDARKAKEEAQKKAEKEGVEFDEDDYDRQVEFERQNAAMVEDEAPADTAWLKNEYVPVTSFIHTMNLHNNRRIYQAYDTPDGYYAESYATMSRLSGDSIYDRTRYFEMKNTFAIALLEGFNKWAKAGLKGFIAHDLRHYTLPDTTAAEVSHNESRIYLGGQISKKEGKVLHYNATAEFGVLGDAIGDMFIDGTADLNFRLLSDTIQLAADGFLHISTPSYYQKHYHSRHFWWDNNDLKNYTHARVQGRFSLQRTKTHLRVAIDNLTNYIYFGNSYTVNDKHQRLNNTAGIRQTSDNISVFTASLGQDLRFGLLNLNLLLTYQKSSHEDIIPVPALNAYANLFLRFKISRVLDCDFGADVRYFTKYEAPDYVPSLAQYAVQENADSRVKIGNYPFVNVYANFFLKHARFFVMMSHVNSPADGGNYFLTPHYPTNTRVLRFGVSWNFFN